jgi:hypothetical protein
LIVVRAQGVEPWPAGQKPAALPLSYTRFTFSARSDGASRRQKQPLRRQQRLKRPRGAARARIVAPEPLDEFLVTVHDTVTALDAGLRREALAALARDLESTRRLRRSVSWHTSLVIVVLVVRGGHDPPAFAL